MRCKFSFYFPLSAVPFGSCQTLSKCRTPEASWHADYRDTAYIYIGGLPFDLSEGDIVTIFSQYGEPVHVNLIRDKDTGKSKGFAFLKYEDQRSTDLAVDNLGGATVMGRVLRVDHTRYKRKEEEGSEDNVATIMDGNTGPSKDEDTDTERRERPGYDSGSEEQLRPMLKEEIELAELLRNHDDEDPMKEYLIQEKKDEVTKALERMKSTAKKSSSHGRHSLDRSDKSRHHRHHHHHRDHHRRRSNSSRSRERSRRERDYRDVTESPHRKRRDGSRNRSRRERD